MKDSELLKVMEARAQKEEKFLGMIGDMDNLLGVASAEKISTKFGPTGEYGLTFYVEQKKPESDLPKKDILPKKIGKFITDVVETGPVSALAISDYRKYQRPALMGTSGGHPQVTAGTNGMLVTTKDKKELCILTNNHVAAWENKAKIGDPYLQPARVDGGTPTSKYIIGHLLRFIQLNFKTGSNMATNLVDAALAKVVNSHMVSPQILGVGALAESANAAINMVVKKGGGRTTGVTSGKISTVDALMQVSYDTGVAIFKDQIIITGGASSFSQGGDSGSVIITMISGKPRVVGLLFAGSATISVANHIGVVFRLLNAGL